VTRKSKSGVLITGGKLSLASQISYQVSL
jgi:hypothetical protein